MEDSLACIESVFAVFRAGLVLVPVDPKWGEGLHRDIVGMSGCRAGSPAGRRGGGRRRGCRGRPVGP